ncbi:oligopeptide/dipeptide ABC transporter ATP-binding protein [Flavimaricola marinus]|uniref:Nickel import system ATP-binding protein NikD n=1 Tax=Flavimaricola marinus TaxID=1819565 RepID=A0A238LEL8_9RHOB|nr:oligopeptide/dipeptide ABC transporter ATP-binding protein [Flavimaricola marinus]SMY08003.1 Oligopeptide transport ATP-binding protein OppD [Flavimaricola marinus]
MSMEMSDTKSARPVTPVTIASVRGLKVHFQSKAGRVHAVDGVDFDVRDGETLGLVGETGCGKSVTGRAFLRLLPVPPGILAGGSVMFRPQTTCPDCQGDGCERCDDSGRRPAPCPKCRGQGCTTCDQTGIESLDLLTISDARMRDIRGDRIAMIFQDPSKALNPTLTIGEQLGEVFLQHRHADLLAAAGIAEDQPGWQASALRRLASQQDRGTDRLLVKLSGAMRRKHRAIRQALDERIAAALSETQIPNPQRVMQSFPHELSGGMRQRVMIAQALACDPDLIIADEPTTALDVTVQARILDLVRQLQTSRGSSVIYISHDLSVVRHICDRVAVMYAGRVVEIGDVEQLFTNPRHPYTQGLLAAVPTTRTPRGQLAAIPGSVPELIDPGPSCRFADRCAKAHGPCASHDPALQPVSAGHDVACFLEHPITTASRARA